MIKKKISIKGEKVHDVGYRLFLMNIAEDFGIESFDAKNVKEDRSEVVNVLVESSEDNIKKFFNQVKKDFPPYAKVDTITIEDYAGRVKTIASFRSGFDSYQLSKIANSGVGMLDIQGKIMNIQEKMLCKLDEIKSDTSQIRLDTAQIKSDTSQIRLDTAQIPDIKANTSEMKETLAFGIGEIVTIKREQGVIKKEQSIMKKDMVRIKKAVHMV